MVLFFAFIFKSFCSFSCGNEINVVSLLYKNKHMSLKTDYIKMRNTQKYDLQWFYNYWKDSGGKEMNINKFGQIFNSVNLDEILSFLDKKFELFILVSAPEYITDVFGQKVNKGSRFIKCFQ